MSTLSVKKKKQRRSEKIPQAEFSQFKKWVKSFDTKIEASDSLKISRTSLYRILAAGTAKPNTVKAIRRKLKAIA